MFQLASKHASQGTKCKLSNNKSTAATGSLFESGSTLEYSNDGKDTSKHTNDDKHVSHVRVDTGKDSETDLPDPQLSEQRISEGQ